VKNLELVVIDGSRGEGGGQVVRTSLSLAVALGRSVRIEKVRAGRKKPGLLRQHLCALRAAAEICGGELVGDELGSTAVELHPGELRGGRYEFQVGSAGSAMLVLQTVLPALLLAPEVSELVLEGGTHNPWAPPFEAIAESFLPVLARTGVKAEARLERAGFYPAGGGRVHVRIEPTGAPRPLELLERSAPTEHTAEVLTAHLRPRVAEKETSELVQRLGWPAECIHHRELETSPGPGNAIHVYLRFGELTEVFTGFGARKVGAEKVVESVVKAVRRYLKSGVPVGPYLADQLLLPLALLAGGRFLTVAPTQHTRTNVEVIEQFLGEVIRLEERSREECLVEVDGRWMYRAR